MAMSLFPNDRAQTELLHVTSQLHVDTLRPNPWNTNSLSPENELRLENSIRDLGFFRPIIVRMNAANEYEILGGQHRWEAARRMGIAHVPVFNLGPIDDSKAKKIGLADNAQYGEDDPVALGALMRELGNADDLASFLPLTQADIDELFVSTEVDIDSLGLDTDEIEPPPAKTRVSPTHQMMRFKVPVEDVAWVQAMVDERIKAHKFTEEDSLTNAGHALVSLLNEAKK